MSKNELQAKVAGAFSGALAKQKGMNVAEAVKQATKVNYLRNLRLYNGGKPVKQKLIEDGHFGVYINKDRIDSLGQSVDILPIMLGTKVLDTRNGRATDSTDPESETFQEIYELAQRKVRGTSYGQNFMVYERSTGQFLEMYCNNASLRKMAGDLMIYMPLDEAMLEELKQAKVQGLPDEPRPYPVWATLNVRPASNNDGDWFTADVEECLTDYEYPQEEEVDSALALFQKVAESEGEEVSAEETASRRKR